MANQQFVVVVEHSAVFGPFDDREQAERFAKFATEEIDPARVCPLLSPVSELMNWRDMMTQAVDDAHPF